jgi:hypothetical protein
MPVVVALVALCGVAAASSDGALRGRVIDPLGAGCAGIQVEVHAEDGWGEWTAATTTGREGVFVIRGVPPGRYRVAFTASGFEWIEYREVRIAAEAETALVVPIRRVEGDVFVRRTGSPVVRSTATDIGLTFEAVARRALPGSDRRFNLLAWLPGAVPAADDPWKVAHVSLTGTVTGAPELTLDGLDIAGRLGDPWAIEPPDASLEGGLAHSAGGSAHRPVAVDGALDLTVRDGTGAVSGTAGLSVATLGTSRGEPSGREIWVAPDRVRGSELALGGSAGGGSLAWFAAGAWDDSRDTLASEVEGRDSRVASRRERRRDRDHSLGLGRLRWTGSGLSVALTALTDGAATTGDVAGLQTVDPGVGATTDPGLDLRARTTVAGLSVSWLPGEAVVEASVAGIVQTLEVDPVDDRPAILDFSPDGRFSDGVGGGVLTGGPGVAWLRDRAVVRSGRLSATTVMGRHEPSIGVEWRRERIERDSRRPAATEICVPLTVGGGWWLDPATGRRDPLEATCDSTGDGTADGVWLAWGAGDRLRLGAEEGVLLASGAGETLSGQSEEIAVWLEDRWTATPRLTVRAGVRAAQLQLRADSADSIDSAKLDFDLVDRLDWRLGAAWDPEGTGRSRLFVHVGRYSPPLSSHPDRGVLFGDPAARIRLDLDGTPGEIPGRVAEIRAPAPVAIASGLRPPTFFEVAAGGDYEILGDLAVGASVSLRRWGDEPRRIWIEEAGLQVLAPDGDTIDANPLTGEALSTPVVAPDVPRREDTASIRAIKRYGAGWQTELSLTWARRVGGPAAGRGTDAWRLDGPVLVEPVVVSALTAGASTEVTEHRWQVRIAGSYAWDTGPTLGVVGWWLRGAEVLRLGSVDHDLTPDQRVIAGGGRLADPWSLDLRLEWPIELGKGRLVPAFEVRNLFDRQAGVVGDSRWSVLGDEAASLSPASQRTEPGWGASLRRQAPRQFWAGMRWDF